jgi:hypothetical protein
MGEDRPGDVIRAVQVHLNHHRPVRWVKDAQRPVLEIRANRDDNRIERSELLDCFRDSGFGRRHVGQVSRDGDGLPSMTADIVGEGLKRVLTPRDQGDGGTFRGKTDRRPSSHPTRRPGDEDLPSNQSF